jgi:methionyl-tRNA synthetase
LPSKLTKKRRSKAIHKNKSNLKKKQSKSLKMSRSLNKMKKMVSKRSRKEEASLRQKRMGSLGRKTLSKVLITKSKLKWETLIT